MRTGRETQTYNMGRIQPFSSNSAVNSACGRNLGKYQLGGVIFGCKNCTMKECQSKQLFGLPAQHFSYVKNIDPGLPLFLFNYSDRKLHGIFEASSKGKMYIDPYAWIDNCSELDRTQFPAQVKIRVRLQCQPLSEDEYGQVIADNYYFNNHFWFELDHRQTNRLMSLLASSAFAPGCNIKSRIVSPSLPSTLMEGVAFEAPEYETHHASSSRRTGFTESTSIDRDIEPLDTQAVVKEVNENEMNLIYMKLKELAIAHESQELCMFDNVNDNNDENDKVTVEKSYMEIPADLEEKEERSSHAVEHQYSIGQLTQEVEELTAFKKIQTQKNCYLEQKLMEAELEIHHLKDRCKILESAYNLPPKYVEKKVIQSSVEQHEDPEESLFSVRGFNGESWLSAMDMYCPSSNVIKPLYSMNSVHSYAITVRLNDGSYSPILNKWSLCPSFNQKKGCLTLLSLTNQIFNVNGANGIDIEVLDLEIGK